jgi:hypothetical protein
MYNATYADARFQWFWRPCCPFGGTVRGRAAEGATGNRIRLLGQLAPTTTERQRDITVRLPVTGTERYLGCLPAQVLLAGGHDVVAGGAISGRGSLSEIHTY